jgi:DNA-binding XRE family transcriptional regulator
MTSNRTSWLKGEVSRLFLSGYTQEAIAKEVNLSVGTTNSIVNELISSDDTINLQRQIAIVSKANGISIKQIAANLRWNNVIKLSSLDERKIEKFLNAMGTLFNKFDIEPSIAAKQFSSIIVTMLRNNIEPHRLEEELELKQEELQRIEAKIEDNEKILEQSNSNLEKQQATLKIREDELEEFSKVRGFLRFHGNAELSEEIFPFARAIKDFKDLGYETKEIISKYENMNWLTRANEKLEAKLQKSEKVLSYKRKKDEEEAKWNDRYNAIEIFTDLVKNGLRGEDIFNVINIINKDFPGKTISQIVEDIRTYGSLSAAVWRLERKYDAITEPML